MPPRLLIVDDDAAFRRLARRLLEGAFEVVGEAATAAEARASVRAMRPDVVHLDVRLPDGDGLSLAGELRAGPGAGAPLVVLTSSDDVAAVLDEDLVTEARGFIPKAALDDRALIAVLEKR
jgi:two-component system nitrate/nitrite response regulator NarL